MEVTYQNRKMEKLAGDSRKRLKEMGKVRAERFEKRISELKAATCLEDLRFLPQARIHPLSGNRKGQFSADLDQPYRLIFRPDHDPEPRLEDGGWDWSGITSVTILEIADTHE